MRVSITGLVIDTFNSNSSVGINLVNHLNDISVIELLEFLSGAGEPWVAHPYIGRTNIGHSWQKVLDLMDEVEHMGILYFASWGPLVAEPSSPATLLLNICTWADKIEQLSVCANDTGSWKLFNVASNSLASALGLRSMANDFLQADLNPGPKLGIISQCLTQVAVDRPDSQEHSHWDYLYALSVRITS
ncbi:hypothetical protein BX616_001533 [Lobosporangium transversale]|uniref:Uncharacterized protein n=1 Tax=Lobosporangium transversale TaxID=64571 RepID=A0A1Y2GQX1_9FUNG|nr:hypothetical protein BCR41DRAFT_395429 [Lobosporangium transversale]KAF9903810.1 hypothetical protein BX616_001533 [Lobosporangium transversale]ORZ19296.1 hypothetical protein BCR41DRAFT_395429 [Lobosporangium transversale]|eukprot:XP_021882464.1 hypothetical protein BCR41DRAFT_395429 [Lobosporangium transversale]